MNKNGQSRVLIVCAHRPGRSPSQRYRYEQYLPFLREKGFEFTFSPLLDERDDRVFYKEGHVFAKAMVMLRSIRRRLKDLRRLKNFDIIFIQREASFFGSTFFERRAFLSGAYIVFDFDDSIWLADTSPGNKQWEWLKKPRKFFDNITYAKQVIAGNDFLAAKAREYNKHTLVIPTTIDTDLHYPKPELRGRNFVTIGWSGSITTVKHFELLLPVLRRLKDELGEKIRFRILGANPQYELASLTTSTWSAEKEVAELNSFDIGVMPLPDDEWASGKCGLKGLSYMSCGVAAIMSDVGVNRKIISHGNNGFLARTPDDWYSYIKMLAEDRTLRERIGEEGRKTVVEKYSVATHRSKYLTVFENAKARTPLQVSISQP
jgi:glycosyltransferase involved in cell wall biosynthesis